MSATPGAYELQRSKQVVEQLIRPTGIVDPAIEIHPTEGQVDDLMDRITGRVEQGERVLVTTLTKRLAEDLATYFTDEGVSCKWLHSELDAFERVELLRDLRQGKFEALVGVNLLREGLDLPEVSMVAILDADKEGFLRSETSLMQTIGRAARNVNAKVVLYADKVTDAMQRTIDETARRRALQEAYNKEHGITPETIKKAIHAGIVAEASAHAEANAKVGRTDETIYITEEYIAELEAEMFAAAETMEFERAATIRDRIGQMRDQIGKPMSVVREKDADEKKKRGKKKMGDPAAWKGRVPRPKKSV
jgi:excinuclease ABC subunit B